MPVRIGTILDLARCPGMPSIVTLRAIIARHPDFPIIQRGKRGRGYRIDLDAASRFVADLRGPVRLSTTQRHELIRALGLTMISPDDEGN